MIRFFNAKSAIAVLAAVLSIPTAFAATRPPVEAFGNLPFVSDIMISPDGRHIAVLRREGGRRVVVVTPVSGGQPKVFRFEDGSIDAMLWANSDRLLIYVRQHTSYDIGISKQDFTRVISVSAADGKPVVLFKRRGLGQQTSSYFQIGSGIVNRLPRDPDHVLMAFVDERGRAALYKVNVEDASTRKVDSGGPYTVFWSADHLGERLLRQDAERRTGDAEFLVKLPGKEWESIFKYKIGSGKIPFAPAGFSTRPDILYVSKPHNGRDAIFEFNLATKQMGKLVFAHKLADVNGLEFDDKTGTLYAARYVAHEPEVYYFDEARAALQARIDSSFPNTSVNRIISSTDDDMAHIIAVSGPSTPRRFYYFDLARNTAQQIAQAYPELAGVPMGPVRLVTYKARDGLEIPAYLTLPPGVAARNLPLVALPHGGPAARDVMSFDFWAQFLANRGYAVLQPQFRGSDGFGQEFAEAGVNEWGGKMQDDVTDGVLHLIAQGIVDRNRICIMGGSYGGYAALMGAVKTPDLYRCAISFAGVSDLLRMLQAERYSYSIHYWKRHIGDPSKDRDKLAAASPARQVARIKCPILLMHGKNDLVVPIDQSEYMALHLRQAGKPYKFVEMRGEDHHLTFGETRTAMLRETEAFLAQHLGTRATAAR